MSGSATGVDGLGSTHAWTTIDLTTTLVTLNDFTVDLSAAPVFKLLEIPNFYSGPDGDDNRNPKTGALGEELLTSYGRGKSFEYHGAVQGATRDICLIGKSTLISAFGPDIANGSTYPERRMIMTPESSNYPEEPPAGNPHTYVGVCRLPQMDDIPPRSVTEEGFPPLRWALPFVLQMRITDGLFYEWDPVGHTTSNPKYA